MDPFTMQPLVKTNKNFISNASSRYIIIIFISYGCLSKNPKNCIFHGPLSENLIFFPNSTKKSSQKVHKEKKKLASISSTIGPLAKC